MSVLSHLTNTSNKLVLSDTEKSSITTSIITLKSRLTDFFKAEIKEQLQFGSSTRGTILPRSTDEYSDIDYMIYFSNTTGYKPQTYIDRLKRFAEAKYSTSEISQSHPTVVLTLGHIKFDLVPAYKGTYVDLTYIPGPRSGFSEWITTDPNGFNKQLTDKNQASGYYIKPMIRLVKYWNAQNGYVYNSYELEQSLTNNYYWSCTTLKDYFYSAIHSLSTTSLPPYKADRVTRAQEIVQKARKLEADNMPFTAESEIKKLIPAIE